MYTNESLLFLLFLVLVLITGLEHDNALIRKCEVEAMRIGTTLADLFNAPGEKWGHDMRMHQLYLIENLGFYDDIPHNDDDIHSKRKASGWVYEDIQKSRYWPFANKWIYIYGDSTSRQIFEVMYKTVKKLDTTPVFDQDFKLWVNTHCPAQGHRHQHTPLEGW